eukprot:GSChrysophyteH2.ASY1.ANO1.1049.1 assembled CDS
MSIKLVLLALAVSLQCSLGFYLPGVAPHSFQAAENVELKVNKLSSVHTQLPFDYYSLNFCKPKDGIKPYSENLGEFLRGDRIENSAYDISLLKDEYCRVLCQVDISAKDSTDFSQAIKRQYHHNWIVDNLPAAWDGTSDPPPSLDSCASNKHVDFDSVKNHQKVTTGNLIFTYGVEWRESEVKWASRWDVYLSMNHAVPDKVHWFSIVNSLLIVMFLAFMVAMILVRTLTREINRYNRVMTDEEKAEEREETGWKLVHADVFRPPTSYPMLFCVLVGTGMQLFFSNRGSLMIGLLLLFVLMGSIGGFISARLYKSFKGKQWQRATLFTALLFPGIAFMVFFTLNLLIWSYGSTGAIPFLSMLAILTLWFGISVPLVFLGAYFGYKKDPIEFPVVTSNIPRQIPEQPWYLHVGLTALLGGILPFGACFVELFFVMSSIWMDQYYYVFGFLLVVFAILVVTCAEISVVLCYFSLCAEDYRWWWKSLLTSGSTALYVFLYSMVYFARLEGNMLVTYLLYFGYMSIISMAVFLVTGAVGFFACLYFNYMIYRSVRVD